MKRFFADAQNDNKGARNDNKGAQNDNFNMKKLLHINPVLRTSTSTGRIIQEIGTVAMAAGWDNYIAYSKGRDGIKPSQSKLIPVGSKLSVAWHGALTRFFDMHGLGSRRATRRFVSKP